MLVSDLLSTSDIILITSIHHFEYQKLIYKCYMGILINLRFFENVFYTNTIN